MPNARTLATFFGSLAVITAAVVFGVNTILKKTSPPPAPPPSATLQPPAADVKIQEPAGGNGEKGPTFHIQRGAVDRRAIRYTPDGFEPKHITIQATDDIGCLVTVVNHADVGLRVGVNPHSAAGDPGADYGVIAPGAAGVLDVRYSGFDAMTLHNHNRPGHGFEVIYGPGCK